MVRKHYLQTIVMVATCSKAVMTLEFGAILKKGTFCIHFFCHLKFKFTSILLIKFQMFFGYKCQLGPQKVELLHKKSSTLNECAAPCIHRLMRTN